VPLVAWIVAAAVVLTHAPTASAAPLAAADAQFVDDTVAQIMQAQRLPGVALLITGPKGTYEKSYGLGNVADAVPFAVDDHVRIASITKSFVATAVLQQVRAGRLKLSDRLASYVKGIPNGRSITIRQVLAMRAGIYSFTDDQAFLDAFEANPTMAFSPRDVLAIIRRHKPNFAPGARTLYSDSNYILLGLILERVTGRPVESVITGDIIRPLGLTQTSFPTTAAMPVPFAHGYYAGPDSTRAQITDITAVNPAVAWTAGAMISTVRDLQKWGQELLSGSLIGPRLQRERLRLGTIPNGKGPPVGYGLGILRFADWYGHDGAIFGFSTETFQDRRTGAQIVVATNLSSNFTTPAMDIFGLIAQHLYPESVRASG
jgi:D-alanyl-D-alanine carboxypeptidase